MRPLLSVALLLIAVPSPAAEDLACRVKDLAQAASSELSECRRDLHTHPELSNREQRTARMVAERLRGQGISEIRTGVARNGVVAVIRGGKPGSAVALRADMDALPVQEQSGLPFASENRGAMHACGHDAHTAMLLGTARVLMALRDQIPGTVTLIFQPAEEGVPLGEVGGARQMIAEGALENPPVQAIFGLHVHPELETGQIGFRAEALMANVDGFKVTIVGRQSHGALPWQGVDPIVTAAEVITALQTIRSRVTDAREPCVVSVGIVRGGTARNIIPQEVELQGTIRTHDAAIRRQVEAEFRRIVTHTAQAHGAKAIIEYSSSNPAVWNDPKLTAAMRPTLARVFGQNQIVEVKPMMIGEDFAHYAQKVPGLFMFLGVHEGQTPRQVLHSPQFVLDEKALPLGVQTLALLALDYLSRAASRP